ncbi:benzyl alcohol O-benzoyltransferase-like [Cucurbita pepo subsp. pepo]|uniref:benzyl alcohol O-benzoyltransferase-like n=1 Tax=Cucurbita pepo subsp. pepo TaxID=3664 RepID=UPI000C9D6F06|nr:benzyl alcohol O-benzoyltransferase-like [Cucurbita pepo subsp. pepo]
MSSANALVFKVERSQPELVVPIKPTPQEWKQLSDIDDQEGFRCQFSMIQFYRNNPSMEGRDPVKVIKGAVAKTLVFYYPFAGRIREGLGRKLFVECTGEGILFIEANADVTLEQLENSLQPPFPCIDELLYNVPNSDGILDSPLLLIQVTRLKCGGFIFAVRFNHAMTDCFGMVQFIRAIAEMARGALAPSILPVWQRALLSARDPPRVTCLHLEYDQVDHDIQGAMIPFENMTQRSFFFGPTEISIIRETLPTHFHNCSSSEILTIFIWRLRTIALQLSQDEEVCLLCLVNLRTKFNIFPLGYYGNAVALPAAFTTAGKLSQNRLSYAMELVEKAKAKVTEEYMKSMVDLMVIKGRPHFSVVRSLLVADLTEAGFEEVDYGWGKAIYGGPVSGGVGLVPGLISFCIPFKNRNGEKGIVVPLCLPAPAMERFVAELDALMNIRTP